jgi:predicted DsbA family dithiol-disulfide isomerase
MRQPLARTGDASGGTVALLSQGRPPSASRRHKYDGLVLWIDIYSDIVCPWCFIGKRHLASAIARVRQDNPTFECQLRWRPFFLNPDTPPEGEPYLPFLEHKFGGRRQVEVLFERVRSAGHGCGIEFAFEKIRLRANTLSAHRLLHWAQERGSADSLVERLFCAQFLRGEHVGDAAVLVRIAAECGYDPRDTAACLSQGRYEDVVRQNEREARQMDITMIPTFDFDGRIRIVGAQDPAILAKAIGQALRSR